MIVEADLELIKDSFSAKEIETNSKTLRESNRGSTKESIIDWTQFSENLPPPLFIKEGLFLPLVSFPCRKQAKGGREGFYKNFFSVWFIRMSPLLWTD